MEGITINQLEKIISEEPEHNNEPDVVNYHTLTCNVSGNDNLNCENHNLGNNNNNINISIPTTSSSQPVKRGRGRPRKYV